MRMNPELAQLAAQINQGTGVPLNREQRRAAKRKRKCQSHQVDAQNTPVGRLMKRDGAVAGFKSLILDTRIKILTMADGCDATEMLSSLAVVIGTVCEAGARQFGHEPPWVRQLHGALRTVHAMCLDGYKWQPQYAMAMDCAVELAAQDRPELDARIFMDAWDDARTLADNIWTHTVGAGAVST